MPLIKLQLPQETFEKLLTVADRDWRPTVWQAEFLLKTAIEREYDANEKPLEPAGVASRE